MRHVLVKDKAQADRLYGELRGRGRLGRNRQALLTGSGLEGQGRPLHGDQGQLVPEFEKAVWAMDTNEVTKPVKTQYGYHIIQALAPIKKGTATPFAQVKKRSASS